MDSISEKIKGWKTQAVAVLVMIDGTLMSLGVQTPGAVALEDGAEAMAGLAVAGVGAVFLVLRRITDSPVGKLFTK